MKQKLLTLFTLLLTVCSGAWGETVVWESDMQETITGVTQTKGRSNDTWTANTGLTWAPEGTYPSRFNCGGGSSALTLQFNSPLSLHANYAIRVYWGSSKENNYRTLSLTLNSESSACASQVNLKNTVRVLEYELTEDVTLNQLKIAVTNDNCYIFKVSIVNLEGPETGETTISYNFIKGTNIAEGNSNNRIKNLSNYSSTITTSTLEIGSNNSKDGYSGQITGHAEAFSESSYVALSFKVADGYTFEPSSVGVTVFANSTSNMKTKVEISDGVTTITSNELACSSSADSNVSFAEGAFTNKKLSGTVTIKIYQWGVTSKRAYIKSPVTISGTVSSATPKTSTTTTISGGSGLNKDIKNGTSAGTLTASVTAGGTPVDGATVTWSSTDTSIAEVNVTTGAITLVAPGDVHITATYDGNETYASSFDTYELNVIDSRAVITPSLTYDNPTLILGVTTTANPSLSGNTGGGEVTFSSDNTDVATVDENTGVVTAHAVGTAHITASVAATSEYRAGSAQATITVINDPTGSHTVTYTLDVTSEEDKNKTDINSSNVSTSLSLNTLIGITNNTGGSYTTGSKKDLTVKIPTPAVYDENKYMSVGFTVADGYVFVPTTVSVKAQPVTTNKDVKLVLTNGTKSIDKTQTCTAGSITTVTMTNDEEVSLTGDVTLKIYCYGADDTYRLGSPITISGDVIKVDQVNIAANKEWITYCSTNALDFSEDIEGLEGAYTISSHTSGATTLTATKMSGAVKAGTGLLLHAANVDAENAQVIRIPVAASGDEQSDNMLKGVIVATAIEPTDGIYTNLGLKNGSFVPYSAAGTIAANKAYLQIPTDDMPAAGAKLTIIFDDEASDEITAIAGVEVKKGAGVVYNLAGQRVSNPTKGLYIINGKKVIIK